MIHLVLPLLVDLVPPFLQLSKFLLDLWIMEKGEAWVLKQTIVITCLLYDGPLKQLKLPHQLHNDFCWWGHFPYQYWQWNCLPWYRSLIWCLDDCQWPTLQRIRPCEQTEETHSWFKFFVPAPDSLLEQGMGVLPGAVVCINLQVNTVHPEHEVSHRVEEAELLHGVLQQQSAGLTGLLQSLPGRAHSVLTPVNVISFFTSVGFLQPCSIILHLVHLRVQSGGRRKYLVFHV